MSRYLLDTNIVSETVRSRPRSAILDWIDAQRDIDLFIATLTAAELRRGVLQRAPGHRQRELSEWFEGPAGPEAWFGDRILPFDLPAAMEWARLMAEGTMTGRPRSGIDMIIAATATANDCIVVTGNERHFQGVVDFVNPLSSPG